MKLILGDCLEKLKELPDCSVDSVVTDPPYGLKFMGKKWDYDVPGVAIWQEVLRVLKPGGHLLSFGGTRTYHRMVVNIEDAGFEIRDQIQWIYGSGFPKSLNIGKAIDKLQGNERIEVEPTGLAGGAHQKGGGNKDLKDASSYATGTNAKYTKGNSPYEGFGTALKPVNEPICLARKPVIGTIAENVLRYGTGGLNVDGCRVGGEYKWRASDSKVEGGIFKEGSFGEQSPLGRFPANVIHDGSDEVVGLFPNTKSGGVQLKCKAGKNKGLGSSLNSFKNHEDQYGGFNDSGSAARFFYCAKASRSERNAGLEGMEEKQTTGGGGMNNTEDDGCGKYGSIKAPAQNHHPTVKPIALMQYLCRLITPPKGTVLDPFMGSGSTGIAALREGFEFIGIELSEEYLEIATKRIEPESRQSKLFT